MSQDNIVQFPNLPNFIPFCNRASWVDLLTNLANAQDDSQLIAAADIHQRLNADTMDIEYLEKLLTHALRTFCVLVFFF